MSQNGRGIKRKPPQSDLFRALEEPEDVELALAEENELRDYARRLLAQRKARTGHGNDD